MLARRLTLGFFAVRIYPAVWFLIVNNLIFIAILYYSSGQNAVLWWAATTALLYSVFALNSVLHLEDDHEQDQRIDEQVSRLSEEFQGRLKGLAGC
jgi:hypothetical protein